MMKKVLLCEIKNETTMVHVGAAISAAADTKY